MTRHHQIHHGIHHGRSHAVYIHHGSRRSAHYVMPPASTANCVIVPFDQAVRQYDRTFPIELNNKLSQQDFYNFIDRCNEVIAPVAKQSRGKHFAIPLLLAVLFMVFCGIGFSQGQPALIVFGFLAFFAFGAYGFWSVRRLQSSYLEVVNHIQTLCQQESSRLGHHGIQWRAGPVNGFWLECHLGESAMPPVDNTTYSVAPVPTVPAVEAKLSPYDSQSNQTGASYTAPADAYSTPHGAYSSASVPVPSAPHMP